MRCDLGLNCSHGFMTATLGSLNIETWLGYGCCRRPRGITKATKGFGYLKFLSLKLVCGPATQVLCRRPITNRFTALHQLLGGCFAWIPAWCSVSAFLRREGNRNVLSLHCFKCSCVLLVRLLGFLRNAMKMTTCWFVVMLQHHAQTSLAAMATISWVPWLEILWIFWLGRSVTLNLGTGTGHRWHLLRQPLGRVWLARARGLAKSVNGWML